ncbi:MAG: DNA polymerase III subunit delta [Candidatus Berkelbacteria bacterium]|nr:DNA polymerase III subunit delta [Candidatus Berkelbacteria bacterium]
MVLFFYGPNTFLISRKLKELKNKYIGTVGGDLNITSLVGEQLTFEDFVRSTQAVPLLSSSRLVIIEGLFKNQSKETLNRIKAFLPKIPESSVVVFVEYNEPDKRLGLFKALLGYKIQRFPELSFEDQVGFAKEEVRRRSGKIEASAARMLASYVGGDLWRLSSEIEKLTSCKGTDSISEKDIQELVYESVSANAFLLIDHLARHRGKEALGELINLIRIGEPPLRILSLINYQLRAVAQIKDAQEKTNNNFAISQATGLAPFQVAKLASVSRKLSWEDLSIAYEAVVLIDEKIKTGKIEPDEGLKDLVMRLGLVQG